jgi:hypothetical protein
MAVSAAHVQGTKLLTPRTNPVEIGHGDGIRAV